MDPNKLWLDLADGHLWLILIGAAVFGALGSLLRPAPEPAAGTTPPSRPWIALSGAAAAVALLYVTRPDSGAALIGGSIVAGFAANAVLAGLQARVLAATAEVKAAASQRAAATHAQLAEARGREALQASHDLEQLARAAEDGRDIRPLVRDLRTRRAEPVDARA
jgi:hypothetical protein